MGLLLFGSLQMTSSFPGTYCLQLYLSLVTAAPVASPVAAAPVLETASKLSRVATLVVEECFSGLHMCQKQIKQQALELCRATMLWYSLVFSIGMVMHITWTLLTGASTVKCLERITSRTFCSSSELVFQKIEIHFCSTENRVHCLRVAAGWFLGVGLVHIIKATWHGTLEVFKACPVHARNLY